MVVSVEAAYDITNVSSSANITLDSPADVRAADILVAAIVCTVGATWTDPADFDIIASSSQAALLRRVCDGNEDSDPFVFTNNQALGNQRGILFLIRGADPLNPISDPKIKTTGATLNPTSDAVTATESGLLVVGLNLITSTTTITVPGGMAEEINDATGQRKAVASLQVPAGDTGAKTWTLGASTASATYSFAVNPADSPGAAFLGMI